MKRLSILISDIYNKFSPLLRERKIEFNLSLAGLDELIEDDAEIQGCVDAQLEKLSQNSRQDSVISLSMGDHRIMIHDDKTVLSPALCRTLSHGRVKVESRVGFGTTVYILVGSIPVDTKNT